MRRYRKEPIVIITVITIIVIIIINRVIGIVKMVLSLANTTIEQPIPSI